MKGVLYNDLTGMLLECREVLVSEMNHSTNDVVPQQCGTNHPHYVISILIISYTSLLLFSAAHVFCAWLHLHFIMKMTSAFIEMTCL